jgi:hypothetical protein
VVTAVQVADPVGGQWVNAGGMVLGAVLSAALAVSGLRRLHSDRLTAFRRFERSVWLSLLLTRVFEFGVNETAALTAIAVDLVLLACLTAELHGLRRSVVRP